MYKYKLLLLAIIFAFFTTNSFGAMDKNDCDKIEIKTGADMLKKSLCKKGSDKLNPDGTFKKGAFFKKPKFLNKFKRKKKDN